MIFDIMNNEITLWDMPDNRVYIKMNETAIKEIFRLAVNIVKTKASLARKLEIKSIRNLYSYIYGDYFIPLKMVKRILDIISSEQRICIIDLIEKNIVAIKSLGNSKPIFNPKFPIKFNAKMSKITGHIIGDGGIYNLNGTYVAHYSNKSNFLINAFKKDIIDIFGNTDIYTFYDKRKDAYRITLPSIVGLILNLVLRKQNDQSKHIPKIILNADKKIKSSFLKALYDDEGDVSLGSSDGGGRSIGLSQKNKKVIDGIKKILKEFRITPGKTGKSTDYRTMTTYYNFAITGKHDFEKFAKEISFDHSEKKEKIKIMLKSYQIDRYKKGEMENKIIELLSKNNMNFIDISKCLKRRPEHRIRKKLLNLEKNNIIASEKNINGFKVYYLKSMIKL